jgi:DNA mismatch repair protein MutH
MALSQRGKTGLAPGMKKVTDWVGRKVETVADMRNGSTAIPAGTVAEVTYARAGLTLKTAPCKCCGVGIFITRVRASDVRLVA